MLTAYDYFFKNIKEISFLLDLLAKRSNDISHVSRFLSLAMKNFNILNVPPSLFLHASTCVFLTINYFNYNMQKASTFVHSHDIYLKFLEYL